MPLSRLFSGDITAGLQLCFLLAALLSFAFAEDIIRGQRPQSTFEGEGANEFPVHLTFDDGPNAVHGPKLLEVLAKHNTSATFFYVGYNLLPEEYGGGASSEHIEQVKRALRAGHMVASHTFGHRPLKKGETDAQVLATEVTKTQHLLEDITGTRPFIFRAPQGVVSEEAHQFLDEQGYALVHWSIDSLDWKLVTGEEVFDSLMRKPELQPTPMGTGGIILMHEGEGTISGVDMLLTELKKRGFTPKPLAYFLEDATKTRLTRQYRCSKQRLRDDKQFAEFYTDWCRQLAPRNDLNELPDYVSVDESRLYAGTPPTTPLLQQLPPTTDGQVVAQFSVSAVPSDANNAPQQAQPEQSGDAPALSSKVANDLVTLKRTSENLQQTAENLRSNVDLLIESHDNLVSDLSDLSKTLKRNEATAQQQAALQSLRVDDLQAQLASVNSRSDRLELYLCLVAGLPAMAAMLAGLIYACKRDPHRLGGGNLRRSSCCWSPCRLCGLCGDRSSLLPDRVSKSYSKSAC